MVPSQQGKNHKDNRAITIEKFMLRLQPEYPKKISASYDAIPLHQADVYANPIELKQADVYEQSIAMQSQEVSDQENQQ